MVLPEIKEKRDDSSEAESAEVYKKRWLMLFLFVCLSGLNSLQWIQYSIIADVICKFYQFGEDPTWVNWTSMIYMVVYIPFIFPASYLMEKLGLRKAVLLGATLTCLGAWVKVASVSPDRFWIGFFGQTLSALGQVFLLSIPALLAAVWFAPSQVSSACSIGVFGNQLGIAIGFLLPPMIVSGEGAVESQLYQMFIGVASMATLVFVLIIIFFREGPPTPPIHTKLYDSEKPVNFLESLKKLFLNRSYMCILLAYGINVGIFCAISTLLNQIILDHYEDAKQDAGRIGLVIVVAGMLGSLVCGIILDATRRFKETTVAVYALSFVAMIVYTFTLSKGLLLVYLVSGLLGFFMTGLLPVGFEMATELTYPEPEGTSSGMLNAASQIFGIIFTNLYSVIYENVNDFWANGVMCIMLVVGMVLIVLMKNDLRRQEALEAELNIKKTFLVDI